MSSSPIHPQIAAGRLVPVIAIDNADDAVPLCEALAAGGLRVAEITFRTPAARESIRRVAAAFPDFALGAGTVTQPDELEAAIECGARFAVAPGTNPRILAVAAKHNFPFYPGVANPSDVELALEHGASLLKFFPASLVGGVPMISALYAVYRHRGIKFVPTGGITDANLAEYLATPGVLAVGGSWFVAGKLIAARNWAEITRLTRAAMDIVAVAPTK